MKFDFQLKSFVWMLVVVRLSSTPWLFMAATLPILFGKPSDPSVDMGPTRS